MGKATLIVNNCKTFLHELKLKSLNYLICSIESMDVRRHAEWEKLH